MLSNIHDWQVVASGDTDLVPVIHKCTLDYWVSRSQSLLVCLIDGVSSSLTFEVLEHVEYIFQSHCSADEVLSRLLVAPLKDRHRAEALARVAMADGFATVGGFWTDFSACNLISSD